MNMILLFGACLLLSVLVSDTAARTVLSTALIVLVVGAFAARLGWVALRPDSPLVDGLLDPALFTVLFVEAIALRRSNPNGDWPLAARGIALGLVTTVGGVALLATTVAGFGWLQALLLGAALTPTGPMINRSVAALRGLAAPWRGMLQAHSALIGGLAVALLMLLIDAAAGPVLASDTVLRLIGGIALGVALPALVYVLVRMPGLRRASLDQPFLTLAVAALLYGVAQVSGVNPFLAGFTGALMLGWLEPRAAEAFATLGDQLAGLACTAAVLIFGVLLSPALIRGIPAMAWLAVLLCIGLVRPAATAVSMIGVGSRSSLLAVGWLAPTPFTAVILGLLVLRSGIPQATIVYAFIAALVVASVVIHSATDFIVTRSGGAAGIFEPAADDGTWISPASLSR